MSEWAGRGEGIHDICTDLPVLDTAETLEEISTGFQIGFGTFVDKPTLPYARSSYET